LGNEKNIELETFKTVKGVQKRL